MSFHIHRQFLLNACLESSEDAADRPVDERDQDVHGHVIELAAADDLGVLEHFRNGDHRRQRRTFDQVQQHVAHRRNGDPQGLRHNNFPHDEGPSQPQRISRFPLSVIDGIQR